MFRIDTFLDAPSILPRDSPLSDSSLSRLDVPRQPGKVRFLDLPLEQEILRAVADLGFEFCSPIQAKSLPYTLTGNDVVAKGQTGTGKTAAFLLTLMDDMLKNPLDGERYLGEPRALVIAPTRELVMQIADDARLLAKYTDLKIHTLVGGMDYDKQRAMLHYDLADLIIATPGRLMDFAAKKDLYLDRLESLVIDEADRMLDMGFIPQVRRIVRMTPRREHRQTLLFSATFTPDVLSLADQWTHDSTQIVVEAEKVAADSVDQRVYMVGSDEKYRVLRSILKIEPVDSVIIFANRRDQTRRLFESLKREGFNVGMLSGEVAQQKRVKTLEGFKSGRIQILVATDVAGRGIHVKGISHVVNFTLPEEPEDYVHRIGRTGRAGQKGVSISLACEDDALRLEPIEALLGMKINATMPPSEMFRSSDEWKAIEADAQNDH